VFRAPEVEVRHFNPRRSDKTYQQITFVDGIATKLEQVEQGRKAKP
jgi:hypothetical protein